MAATARLTSPLRPGTQFPTGAPTRIASSMSFSGAMMVSVLAGLYPDGERLGQCAESRLILTGAKWARRVYDAYPGYSGALPKV
ncbi:hypothetical protein BD309DRAFT_975644 [Dichomitus squalens]|uniref:Uncharacterized protein n=1 Tax=Dichomitus squalens TaxID=114155 RepID=A0A4V2K2F8_9APHY|nr:hypothetical protein BD309DRAFT_975644 [Dichomitus squalens]TBU56882.1 hypothetical protein BD310DRAFT_590278 [Dichomitus squalens]